MSRAAIPPPTEVGGLLAAFLYELFFWLLTGSLSEDEFICCVQAAGLVSPMTREGGLWNMATKAASEYAFVNARIRGIKSYFLPVGEYERLLQSGSYEDFIKLLANTHYGPVMQRESPQGMPMPDELAIILSKDFVEVSYSISRSLTGRVS